MQKPLLYSLVLAIAFTGCSAFKSSPTWHRVVENHDRKLTASTSKSTYFDRLHAVLSADNVEHKVVAYRFNYRNQRHEVASASALALIYRDPTSPTSPWWITDENTAFPVWVPDGTPAEQVSFFLQRKVEILAQRDFPASGGGRASRALPAIAASDPTDADGHFGALFRKTHGTAFDPRSRIDRVKMAELRRSGES